MPQTENGYRSLNGNNHIENCQGIYQTTTEPHASNAHFLFESMKRAFGYVIGMGNRNPNNNNCNRIAIDSNNDDDHLNVKQTNEKRNGNGNGNGNENGNGNVYCYNGNNSIITMNKTHDTDALLNNTKYQQVIIGSREYNDKSGKNNSNNCKNNKMPSASINIAEEASLLGSMSIDSMDDIELRSVQLGFPHARNLIIDACHQRRIPTDKGDILVAIQGDINKPAILTYHDLGLNYATSFAGFFNYPLMRGLLENFCVYHVNAPGQEDTARTLPEDYIYPTMDELANQLQYVLSQYGLKSIIGFGIGAGANILARFALAHPDKVGAMCLINCVSTQSGWIEWGYQSFNTRFLRTKGMTQSVIDYLMWHHFGRNPEERNHDLVQVYKQHFEHGVNPTNLAMFINSYIHRNDLNIARTPLGAAVMETSTCTLKMPIMNITGALSPHVDDTITFNGRLDPTNSTWMKISDCAMVLEEQPGKLAEAFRLFLQGEGYEKSTNQQTENKQTGRKTEK